MYRSGHVRMLFLTIAATALAASLPLRLQLALAGHPLFKQDSATAQTPGVSLRWGPRPGVTRYRLQLARDKAFTDIVFDRVVKGTTYEITDLPSGRYFWRIAALTTKLGEFSSAGAVDLSEPKTSTKAIEPIEKPLDRKSTRLNSSHVSES